MLFYPTPLPIEIQTRVPPFLTYTYAVLLCIVQHNCTVYYVNKYGVLDNTLFWFSKLS
jgi:hypothetical protein